MILAARTARGSCGRSASRTSGRFDGGSPRWSTRSKRFVRKRVQGLVARNGRGLHRRATADLQGRGPRVSLEAKTSHPRYLRVTREPARVRRVSEHVLLLLARRRHSPRDPRSGCSPDQGPRAGCCELALFSAPDARAAVQHGHHEGLQRPDRRERQARTLARLPRDAGGRDAAQRHLS